MSTAEGSGQHYQRAAAAMKNGDVDTAITELDLYLCSDPRSASSMIAWFNLNTVIVQKFQFPNREGPKLSDEEFLWQRRAEKCLENVIEIYEGTVSHSPEASAYLDLYNKSKDRLARTRGFGELIRDADGKSALRGTEVFFRVTLPSLKCLANYEKKIADDERRVFENNAPLKGGLRMQDVARYFIHGLKFADENNKLPAAQFLTRVVENLDEADPTTRKLLETAHFRLAALQSDLDNPSAAVRHAKWVLSNAPPGDMALRMMLETIVKMSGGVR